jgi:beta-lactamase class A
MRVPRRTLSVVALVAFCIAGNAPASALGAPGPLAAFQLQLAAFSLRAPGHVAIAITDVSTGLSTGINPGTEMPAASTIKIPVMVEVFRQLAAGRFDLNRHVTLLSSDKDWGSGDLCGAPAGTSYPVARLLSLMIDVSDNTATNMLIRLVGRRQINATMIDLGLTHTRLTDFIRTSGSMIRRALRSSPADMAHLLRSMARDQLIDEWSSREMIAILRGQQHNGLIPEPLPLGTEIAHKTGTLHDTLNDVGIVYEGEAPYVIAVMTTDLPTLDAGRRFIRGVSRLAYDALGRFASWRESNAMPGIPGIEPVAPLTPDEKMWTPAQPEAPIPEVPLPAATEQPADHG